MLPLSKQRANKNSGLMIAFWLSKLLLRKKWHSLKKETHQLKTERVFRIANAQLNCLPNFYAKREKNCICFSKMSGFLEYFRQSRCVYSRWTKKKLKCNATKLIFPHIYPSLKESRAHLLVTKSWLPWWKSLPWLFVRFSSNII